MLTLPSCNLDQTSSSKIVFASYYLKLSLPMLLKYFLIFALFQPHASYRHISLKNYVYQVTIHFLENKQHVSE